MKKLFSTLFKKASSADVSKPKVRHIDSSQTPEKYRHFQDEVFEFLINNLQALDDLENEIYKRYEVLQNKRSTPSQVHPDEDALWKEYAERCEEIIAPISAKPYVSNSRSFGKPTKYEYLNNRNTKFTFIMKSANRAVVEALFEHGTEQTNQFVLKLDERGWKIDSKKYGFPGEATWHKDEL